MPDLPAQPEDVPRLLSDREIEGYALHRAGPRIAGSPDPDADRMQK